MTQELPTNTPPVPPYEVFQRVRNGFTTQLQCCPTWPEAIRYSVEWAAEKLALTGKEWSQDLYYRGVTYVVRRVP